MERGRRDTQNPFPQPGSRADQHQRPHSSGHFGLGPKPGRRSQNIALNGLAGLRRWTRCVPNGSKPDVIQKIYISPAWAIAFFEEGETPDGVKSIARAGPAAALALHNFLEETEFGWIMLGDLPFKAELEAYRKVYRAYEPADARYLNNHRGHLLFVRPEENAHHGRSHQSLWFDGHQSRMDRAREGCQSTRRQSGLLWNGSGSRA